MAEPGIPRELLVRPFTTSRGLAHVGRRHLVDGREFRRVGHGAWAVADEEPSYGRRIQGVRERNAPTAVLLGPSAAWAHGCRLAGAEEPVHLAGGSRRGPDLVRWRAVLRDGDVVDTLMGPATSVTRTVVDLARGVGTAGLDHLGRVQWIDAFLWATGLPAVEARRAVCRAVGLHGLDRARRVLADARDGVHSPKETELRLIIVTNGFPEPRTQCPVILDGRMIARLDLGWEEYRAGAEYDGAVHRERRQHSHDLDRHNGIRVARWTVLQVDARLLGRPVDLLARLARLVPRL